MVWKELLTEDHEAAADPHPNYVLETTTLTGGVGIATIGDLSTNRTITLDFAELAEETSPAATDLICIYNGSTFEKVQWSNRSPLTTKGDLYVFSTASARLAVGSNNQTLIADSGQSTGLKWNDAPIVLTRDVSNNSGNGVTNTTSETNILNYSVAGGAMGTDKALRCRIIGTYVNGSASARSLTIKVKFGTTTLYDDSISIDDTGSTPHPIDFDIVLFNANSASSQKGSAVLRITENTAATTGTGDIAATALKGFTAATYASSSENTSSAKSFVVTVTHSFADPTVTFNYDLVLLELV
jgi:hypothetical protein